MKTTAFQLDGNMFSVVKLRYIEGRIIRRPLKAGSVLKLRANSSCFMGSTCSLNLKDTNIWLGSGSKSRREIMSELGNELGFSFETISADIDEKAIRTHNPEELVLKLAHAKADAIVERMKTNSGELEGLLITCDQVVVHESRILEKPENEQEAREFIAGYGRAPASTVGSVVCTCLRSGRRVETVDIATVGSWEG